MNDISYLVHRQIFVWLTRNSSTAIYFIAILKYLVVEIIELASNAIKNLKIKRITSRHLQLTIRDDEKLDILIRATISKDDVISHSKE